MITQVYKIQGYTHLSSYLFFALILDSSLENVDRLISSVLEDDHYFVVQCIYVDSLVSDLVGFHVQDLVQRVAFDRFHTVERDAPHLQLVLHLVEND